MTLSNPAGRPPVSPEKARGLFARSALYREWLAEREEIMRHKWIESEKAGGDIGFERALVNWVIHHRANWRATRRQLVVGFRE
jgi:hypothetical protein